jgi:hypothetical protein
VLVATTAPPAVQRPVVVTTPTVTKGAESGKKQILGSASSIIPDCTSDGYPIVTVVKKPSNGQFDAEKTEAFPSFPKDNVRYSCNSQKVPAVGFYYTSTPGFTGTDSLSLNILYPDGSLKNFSFTILVR